MNGTYENIDCMELMSRYPDKHFDLVVSDIPYGINVCKMAFLKEQSHGVKQKNGKILNPYKTKNYSKNNFDSAVPEQEYFNELKRVSRNQIIFGIEYTNWEGVSKGRLKWDKCMADRVSFSKYEIAYQSFTEEEIEIKLLWAGMMQAKSLSEPTTQQGNKKLNEKRIHPTQKPVLLYKKILSQFTTTGDLILDPNVGSASSLIACEDLDLEYVGCEIDSFTYSKSLQRLNTHLAQGKLFQRVGRAEIRLEQPSMFA